MARVDFYVLRQSGEQARQLFACRLAEKAYKLDNSVHILTRDRATAERMDELLWTFRDGSFVPHEIDGGRNPAPVSIGWDEQKAGDRDLLINLRDELPSCADSFARVAELVSADDDCRKLSRHRFTAYRDAGHAIETHKL